MRFNRYTSFLRCLLSLVQCITRPRFFSSANLPFSRRATARAVTQRAMEMFQVMARSGIDHVHEMDCTIASKDLDRPSHKLRATSLGYWN